jgi:predicted nucleic acid-binding protein
LPHLYVLDTNVLSELSRERPNPNVFAWLESEPGAMIIPFGAVIEIERGIVHVAGHNLPRAYRLSKWLDSLQTTDLIHGVMNLETARLYGQMTTVPALHDLWATSPLAKTPTLGQDLSIAAVAIIMGAPVATINIKDFMKIDRFFPLPGLYNPASDEWFIRPRATAPPYHRDTLEAMKKASKRPAFPLSVTAKRRVH